MDIAASLSEGPLLRAAGSCIRIAPESRGMHQAVIVEADISLPWAMRNASSLDVLSVFLIPGGMYIDEYEMQRLLSGSDPPIRIHSLRDSAPYEEIHYARDPSSFTVFATESIAVPKPGSSWSFFWRLPVHLQYSAAHSAASKPIVLHYPFLYLRPGSEKLRSPGRCVRRSYVGNDEMSPTGQFSDCTDLEALLDSLGIQPASNGKLWYQYGGHLPRPSLANGYIAVNAVGGGECRASFDNSWISGRRDESVHLLSSLVLFTTAAFLLVFLLKL